MTTERCSECNHGPSYFAGCSQVECPQRKAVTAAPPADGYEGEWYTRQAGWSTGYRKEPTNHD